MISSGYWNRILKISIAPCIIVLFSGYSGILLLEILIQFIDSLEFYSDNEGEGMS